MISQTYRPIFCAILLCTSALLRLPAQQQSLQLKQFQQYVHAVESLPREQQQRLSSSSKSFYQFALRESRQPGANALPASGRTRNQKKTRPPLFDDHYVRPELGFDVDVARVNDPRLDVELSAIGGFTQNETSAAWCGDAVVVGYRDSGAILRSIAAGSVYSGSNLGVASSSDGGRFFKPLGFLDPGPAIGTYLIGNPSVGCSDPSNFYYATQTLAGVSVSRSSNGGLTWGVPQIAVAQDPYSQIFDQPFLTVDPTNPKNLYISYTDNDTTGSNYCSPRIAIELISSRDAGLTWSTPSIVTQDCLYDTGSSSGAPQVKVDRTGKVYVAYQRFFGAGIEQPDPIIEINASTDHGNTFSQAIEVASMTFTGDGFGRLQGGVPANQYPNLAIDPVTSAVYVAWVDGRDNSSFDPGVVTQGGGNYGYGDIFFSRSSDGGHSWSAASAISPTPAWYRGRGRDQFEPSIAVDHTGRVAVCYYDRRHDPENFLADRYCSTSRDHGASWTDNRKTVSSWLPANLYDSLVPASESFFGDYDSTVTEFSGKSPGFIDTFQIQTRGNPDVYAVRF